MRFTAALVAAMIGQLTLSVTAAPPELKPEDLPRVPPVAPEAAGKTFQVKPGFQLQLVAAEPLVMDPIEICFDENGRLFVVEMRDYSEMRDVVPHLGRVRLLEDTNGDGLYDQATVFADDLPWPTAAFWYDGGLFVAATPNLYYLKDTDGDGRADVRQIVFTGYGAETKKLNVQALVNCLRWGLDNRIHGQTSSNGGLVKRAGAEDAAGLELRGRDFNFDPRTLTIAPENGGGQYGMGFDDFGRKFACSNSRHIMTFMYDAKYADRNPFYHLPGALVDIPVDGPAAEVYRRSPEEAWRVIRTQWRVTGVTPGLIEGGGRSSGYFTSATGISIYRGDAWPADFRGDAFIADVGSNLIHHKKVRPDGVGLLAERPADESAIEFITSTDLWFRPVEIVNAPDGCLYVCDMAREVIEHPWSIPEPIKKLLDLNSGNDRGRIYRIAPETFVPRALPQLGKATTAQLVATLNHSNAWHRETAARLLYERQDQSAAPGLRELQHATFPLARLHALYALDGLNGLRESEVLVALNDAEAGVREHGLKLAEKFFANGVPSPALAARITELAHDPDINVRYQLAFTLGEIKGDSKVAPLAELAQRDLGSRWTRAAILSSLASGAGKMFTGLSADTGFRQTADGSEFLREIVGIVGAQAQPQEVDEVLTFLQQLDQPPLRFAMAQALGEGMARAKVPFRQAGPAAVNLLSLAVNAATNHAVAEAARVPAIQLLVHLDYAQARPLLTRLLEAQQSPAIQLAAVTTLGEFADPGVGSDLLAQLNSFPARVRAEAITALLARSDRAAALLKAIDAKTVPASVLNSTQVKQLREHRDAGVRATAQRVLSATLESSRQQAIETFAAALSFKGDATHGHKIYEQLCSSCHRASGEGYWLGPDLVTVKTTGKEKLLNNILDPNAEVRPEYAAYSVETRDDESYLGLVANQTASSLTLHLPYGKEIVLPRTDIVKMQSQGQSIMPEGLEAGLTPQDLADLLEFIVNVTQ